MLFNSDTVKLDILINYNITYFNWKQSLLLYIFILFVVEVCMYFHTIYL